MTRKQQPDTGHIFGPVPSRRLGRSLGVDLVTHKTCTLDCVYCECGKTTRLTLGRNEYVPAGDLRKELSDVLSTGPKLDFITFSGAGEPTLNSDIGKIIRFLKTEYPQYKVALLTNGTLLYRPDVRAQLLGADLVVASMDAASEKPFSRINRPHPGLNVSRMIDGLAVFRKQFVKLFWIEIFIVPGLNDNESELKQIKDALAIIKPDRIQLNTLDRPGTESWVEPADEVQLNDIVEYLDHVEVIRYVRPDQKQQIQVDGRYRALLSTIKRRPCTAEDVAQILGLQESEVNPYLESLLTQRKIVRKIMPRGVFYSAGP